jgi:hypothetical protein
MVPSAAHALSVLGHDFCKRCDPSSMKSWLYHSALTPVKLALTGEQTLP